MPGPSAASLHVDALLSELAVKYSNDKFIADMALPIYEVSKRSDLFGVYTRRDRLTLPDDEIEPTSEANLARYSVSTDSYSVKDRALADFVSKDEEANADSPFSPLADAQENILQQLMVAREKRVSDLLMDAAAYAAANKVTLTNAWSDKVSGTPVDDIEDGIVACAEEPNVLILSLPTWKVLRRHPDILTSVGKFSGAGGTGLATEAEVASLFELDRILVGRVKYDSANPGAALSEGWIWPQDQALLARVAMPGSRKVKEAVLGRTFRFRPSGQSSIQTATEFIRRRGPRGSTWVQSSFSDDEKLVALDVAYHFTGVNP